ncbi:MAG: hypothetical protein IPM23_17585 [Candidatus Melainabacteria bacterium]|nr:hypothetical protein [Candidatus Melainabacteria bacterium]
MKHILRTLPVLALTILLAACQQGGSGVEPESRTNSKAKPQSTKTVKVERLEDGTEQVRITYTDTEGRKEETVVPPSHCKDFLKKVREAASLGSAEMQEKAINDFLDQQESLVGD